MISGVAQEFGFASWIFKDSVCSARYCSILTSMSKE